MRRQRTQSTEARPVRRWRWRLQSEVLPSSSCGDDRRLYAARQVLAMTIGRATPSGGGTRPPSHRAGPVGSAHRHATAEAPPFTGRAGTCRLGAEKC